MAKNYDITHKVIRAQAGDYAMLMELSRQTGMPMAEALHLAIERWRQLKEDQSEPDKELESLIQFWKDSLAEHRLLMSPSTVDLVNQTIKRLEELKEIKEDAQAFLQWELQRGEVIKLDEDQASLFKEGS